MSLATGTKLGPYEIQSPLGAGGMGEVYRARDTRLQREVAIKVLPETFARDPERLQRFEHEARLLSTVNHPNILAIHDVGSQDGVHYLVSELLEGQTLREKMSAGPLSQRRGIEYSVEIARGLAAAHEKGIIHRDLKPDNIFITKDGRVKILDFGLAKQAVGEAGLTGQSATMTAPTQPGVVLGTVGYMSPEQVRGQALDHRSDIFSFGAILYEMISGKRAFKGDTGIETMNAILKEDPPELSESGLNVTPGLERIVRHCLEKEPGLRFQSARDLAFDIESLSTLSSTAKPVVVSRLAGAASYRTPLLVAIPVLLIVAAAAFLTGRRTQESPSPVFTRLTFRGGHLDSARFSPDGHTIVYGASFGDEPLQVYTTRPDAPQSRELGLKNSTILAISKQDELAITLDHGYVSSNLGGGTLARVPLNGGSPRELSQNVGSADWSPDGQSLAICVQRGREVTVEYPVGHVLYHTPAWAFNIRISPNGKSVAFIDHPLGGDSFGRVIFIDQNGKQRILTQDFSDIRGLAWAPSGKEIWFTASHVHLSSNLYAVDLEGHQRLVWSGGGGIVLEDIASDGRVLFVRENRRRGIAGLFPGHSTETDLSWQDWSLTTRISPDGKWVYFSEEGDGGGPRYSAYMRATDGSPAIRLGDGSPYGVSPDGKWVASIVPGRPGQLWLLPTRAGEPKNLSQPGFDYGFALWTPDGKHLVIQAQETGKQPRTYVSGPEGGPLKPVTPEGINAVITANSDQLISRDGDDFVFYPIDGSAPRRFKAMISPFEVPLSPLPGQYVIGAERPEVPLKLFRYDPLTGAKQPWKELAPPDRAGVYLVNRFDFTPDERWYVYSYVRDLSDLYLVEGLH